MKNAAGKLFVSVGVLACLGALAIGASAQPDPDYPESLGRALSIFKINTKMVPKPFSDFEYFHLSKFPNQDLDNPKRDLKNRIFVSGEVRLSTGVVLKFKKAYLKSTKIDGDDENYKDIYFETEELNGVSYKFSGEFLRERIEEKEDRYISSYTTVMGTLTKYENDRQTGKILFKFYEYAEL